MKLTGARLQNIACFEDVSLDFIDESTSEPAPWVVLLGENGTGKSTILQMLGGLLIGSDGLQAIAGSVEWGEYVRNNFSSIHEDEHESVKQAFSDDRFSGIAQLQLRPEPSEVFAKQKLVFTDWTWKFGGLRLVPKNPKIVNFRGQWYSRSPEPDSLKESAERLFPYFTCGYGTSRRINVLQRDNGGTVPTLDTGAWPYRFASLFGRNDALTNVEDWLAGLYFRTVYPNLSEGERARNTDRYERAKRALEQTLPDVKIDDPTPDREIFATHAGERVPLNRLSDGYRGTFVWVADLVRRLFDAFPDSPDPLHEHGVVLVDEIDLHLHPRWQRSVVEQIRATFPNLQFIVTTHSPFVAQDMRPSDKIIVLERNGKNAPVTARSEPGFVADWSADQIFAALFGLKEGTRGEAAIKAEARYQTLLDADTNGNLSQTRRAELERLRALVDAVPSWEKPEDATLLNAADVVLDAFRRKRDAANGSRNVTVQNGGEPGATARTRPSRKRAAKTVPPS